jgi:hypothetical protein
MERPSNPNVSRGQFRALDKQMRHTPEEEGGGGFSHSVTGEQSNTLGYMVSYPGETRYTTSKSRAQDPTVGYSPSRLPQFVREHKQTLSQSGVYFGAWLEGHEAVFDTSRRYATSQAGHKAMRRYDQVSMYGEAKRNYIYNLHHPKNVERLQKNLGLLGQ